MVEAGTVEVVVGTGVEGRTSVVEVVAELLWLEEV